MSRGSGSRSDIELATRKDAGQSVWDMPTGIDWSRLGEADLKAMPVPNDLRALQNRRADGPARLRS
jgi:hypothetical protein